MLSPAASGKTLRTLVGNKQKTPVTAGGLCRGVFGCWGGIHRSSVFGGGYVASSKKSIASIGVMTNAHWAKRWIIGANPSDSSKREATPHAPSRSFQPHGFIAAEYHPIGLGRAPARRRKRQAATRRARHGVRRLPDAQGVGRSLSCPASSGASSTPCRSFARTTTAAECWIARSSRAMTCRARLQRNQNLR